LKEGKRKPGVANVVRQRGGNKVRELHQRHYELKDFGHLLEVNWRQVVYWSEEKGLVAPFGEPSGPGTARLWSFQNVVEIAIIKRLTAHHNMKVESVKRVLDFLNMEDERLPGWQAKSFKGWLGRCILSRKAYSPLMYYNAPGFHEGVAVGKRNVKAALTRIQDAQSFLWVDVSNIIELVEAALA
jgi:hypothetical protein